jgi:hypothetical protein
MDQDKLQYTMEQYGQLLNELKVAETASTQLSALEAWASVTHGMVEMLLEVQQIHNELAIKNGALQKEYSTLLKEFADKHKLTEAQLTKLDQLQEQFEAVQEMFGARVARGGREET